MGEHPYGAGGGLSIPKPNGGWLLMKGAGNGGICVQVASRKVRESVGCEPEGDTQFDTVESLPPLRSQVKAVAAVASDRNTSPTFSPERSHPSARGGRRDSGLERLGLNVDLLAETPYEKGDRVGEIRAGEFRPVAACSQRELVGYTATGERG